MNAGQTVFAQTMDSPPLNVIVKQLNANEALLMLDNEW